jgi:hypothetical protein
MVLPTERRNLLNIRNYPPQRIKHNKVAILIKATPKENLGKRVSLQLPFY